MCGQAGSACCVPRIDGLEASSLAVCLWNDDGQLLLHVLIPHGLMSPVCLSTCWLRGGSTRALGTSLGVSPGPQDLEKVVVCCGLRPFKARAAKASDGHVCWLSVVLIPCWDTAVRGCALFRATALLKAVVSAAVCVLPAVWSWEPSKGQQVFLEPQLAVATYSWPNSADSVVILMDVSLKCVQAV